MRTILKALAGLVVVGVAVSNTHAYADGLASSSVIVLWDGQVVAEWGAPGGSRSALAELGIDDVVWWTWGGRVDNSDIAELLRRLEADLEGLTGVGVAARITASPPRARR